MTDVTVLRCWPSCIDALDWSEDGVLALASDDRIELLLPNTSFVKNDQDSTQWQHVALQVSWFSNDDLPYKAPMALEVYSIGEEISTSASVAVAWSCSGLATHRRCALAVLTTNLTLSIWAADGKPHEPSSWSRKLVINRALANDFDKELTEKTVSTSRLQHRKRVRCRIRAFAWAPKMVIPQRNEPVGSDTHYGPHFIVVATDDNQLAFLVVQSPTTSLGSSREWTAQVLDKLHIDPGPDPMNRDPRLFEDTSKHQLNISSVAWSPWAFHGKQSVSVVAYATNGNVRARRVSYSCGKLEIGKEVIYWEAALRSDGLMRWSPRAIAGGQLMLAIFPRSGVVCLTVEALHASILATVSHDLDERWDEVSGVAWDMHYESIPRLHISSLSTTLHYTTASFDLLPNTLRAAASPSWRIRLSESSALFSAKNDLKGHIRIKVWGLARSPLGDFIATCSTSHPSDMIEYGPPNDRRVTIAVDVMRSYEEMRSQFPSNQMTAEGVAFTIQKLIQNSVKDSNDIPMFAAELVDKLWKPRTVPQIHEALSISHDHDQVANLGIRVEALQRAIFLDSAILKYRYKILVNRACDKAVKDDLSRALILCHLSTKLITMSPVLLMNSFSRQLLLNHYRALELVHVITKFRMDDRQDTIGTRKGMVMIDQTNSTCPITAPGLYETRPEICDHCSNPIPFTDFRKATCADGHTFPRCGLSLLAIQVPGMTKYCAICDTPVLNDTFVAAKEGSSTAKPDRIAGGLESNDVDCSTILPTVDSVADIPGFERGCKSQEQCPTDLKKARPTVIRGPMPGDVIITLARVLFLACDTCIYCGGKYVG